MFKNYFKIAIRVLLRNKIYVAINIVGLGFALGCCVLSYLNYQYRESFDSNYTHTENIYRLNTKKSKDGFTRQFGTTPLPLGQIVAQDNAGIKRFARLVSNITVVKNNERIFSEKVYYADKAFADIFDFHLSAGSLKSFGKRNVVLISDVFAKKIFNDSSPVNKQITLIGKDGAEQIYTVAGVAQKLPDNSSFQFDLLTSIDNLFTTAQQIDWQQNYDVTTFLEVSNKQSVSNIEKQLQTYAAVYNSSRIDKPIKGFQLEPFKKIAYSSDRDFDNYVYESALNSNPRGVIVIGPAIMSILILLIACFNFTNISISFANNRLKEIGIRKVMGGFRHQIIKQCLTENLLLCTISSLLAIFFVAVVLPSFNEIASVKLRFDFSDPSLYVFLLAMPVITAVVSGMYPSIYISSFNPIAILKGQTTFGSSNRFTKFLLVAQFSLSCFALVVGISLSKNASFQETVDYGYDINEIAVFPVDSLSEFEALSAAIKTNLNVKSVAGTVNQIGEGSPISKVQSPSESNQVEANVVKVGGEDYLKTTGINLISGRHFYTGNVDQDASVIVNETLVSALNFKSPVGKKIKVDSSYYTIIGVVKDYKEAGLHGKVPPMVLKSANIEGFKYLVARINKRNILTTYKSLQDSWHRVLPGKPFNGYLQSELIEKETYMNEGFKSVAYFLALSTIVLSASGIFALVSLNIIRRKKEIGIRKVLGATVLSIIGIINKEFLKIMILSIVVGSVLGFLMIDNFVFRFIYVYHPEVGLMPFMLTFIIIFFTSVITVGTKVYRAAVVNPVKSLRTE